MAASGDEQGDDLIVQALEEMQAECELRRFDYESGRISRDEFLLAHFGALARYRSLESYVIAKYDRREREALGESN